MATHTNSSLREATLVSEKAELTRKLQNSITQNNILQKELEQWKRENGELHFLLRDSKDSMSQTQIEISSLKAKTERVEKEKMILEKQVRQMERESGEMVGVVREAEERERSGLERVRVAEMEVEKVRREKGVVEKKLKEKEREVESVVLAATGRFKGLESRVVVLEREIEILVRRDNLPHPAGDAADEEVLGSRTPPVQQSRADCVDQSGSAPPPVYDISDSDEELPPPRMVKRRV